MDTESKIKLITEPPVCETITQEELKLLFDSKSHPEHYIGFEVSGKFHLGGLVSAIVIKKLLSAGVKPTVFLADYHAWINGKLGGDLERIQAVAKGYFKGAFLSLGLEEGKVRYVLASEAYNSEYWKDVLRISKDTTISRMLRCTTIMGRSQKDALDCASVLYPAMQVADAFMLGSDIMHAGLDQRKAHMLAREIAVRQKRKKPVALHHSLLVGLEGPKQGAEGESGEDALAFSKMSKSKPSSCIFIHDSPEEIERKIASAYCPPKVAEGNPVLEICRLILMQGGKGLEVSRPAKFGGDAFFASYGELEGAYLSGALHPSDLKKATAAALSGMLSPSRKYFEARPELLAALG